jgi:anti-sigma factor RsiW
MREPLGRHGYTCREIVDLAAEYVDGALPAHESTLFERHLNCCDGCSTFIDQIRETAGLAASLDEDELPDSLEAGLLQAFRDWNRSRQA